MFVFGCVWVLGFCGEVGVEDRFLFLLGDGRGDGGIVEVGEVVDLDGVVFEVYDDVDLVVGFFDVECVVWVEIECWGFFGVDGFVEGVGEVLDYFGVGNVGGVENCEVVKCWCGWNGFFVFVELNGGV